MTNSYRFIVKGEEKWSTLKDQLNKIEIKVLKKIKDEKGNYMLFGLVDEDRINEAKTISRELDVQMYSNDLFGCTRQAEKELSDKTINKVEEVQLMYIRTNQLIRLLERLNVYSEII